VSSRIEARLAQYNPQRRVEGLKVPSRMLLALMHRAADTNSDYVNRIVAFGIYGKAFALRLYELAMAQQKSTRLPSDSPIVGEAMDLMDAAFEERTDAGPAELAAESEQPADRAEAVRGA
jgi:hypothetical protein